MRIFVTKLLIFACLVSFFRANAHSQNQSQYRCSYRLTYLKDTLNMVYFRPETYIVQVGEELSKGFSYQKFYLDSLKSNNPKLYNQMFNAAVKKSIEEMEKTGDVSLVHNNPFHYGGFSSELYKDYKKDEIRVRDHISTYEYLFIDELKPQDWKILSDTATILGYPSQKAICHYRGRDWVAWFTLEIPISEGPWKFYGLPGLITKIYDTQKHYSFELIGFQKKEEPIITEIPRTVEKIERKEFIRAKMGKLSGRIAESQMSRVGLSSSKGNTIKHYDYIERDYK